MDRDLFLLHRISLLPREDVPLNPGCFDPADHHEAITGACPPPRMGAQERPVYGELVKLVGGGNASDVNVEDLEQG